MLLGGEKAKTGNTLNLKLKMFVWKPQILIKK